MVYVDTTSFVHPDFHIAPPGAAMLAYPFNFEAHFNVLHQFSQATADLPVTGTSYVWPWVGPLPTANMPVQIYFAGGRSDVNVFEITDDLLCGAVEITLDLETLGGMENGATPTTYINVITTDSNPPGTACFGAASAEFGGIIGNTGTELLGNFLDQTVYSRLLWNFPETTQLRAPHFNVFGSTLAPMADLIELSAHATGRLAGTVAVRSAIRSAEHESLEILLPNFQGCGLPGNAFPPQDTDAGIRLEPPPFLFPE